MVTNAVSVSLIGWFVTPFLSKSIKAVRKYIDEENKSLKNVTPKLKELADHLDGIRVIVDQVGLCFIKGTEEALDHLWRLKRAIYEAEEILDLYESLKNNRLSCEFVQQFTGTKDSPSRLEEVVEKLGGLGVRTRKLLKNSDSNPNIVHGSPILRRGPSQANPGNGFFGYADERHQLQNLLKGKQNKVIAIIGHGGMGKTHLARQVFDANEPGFEVRIWAHVCNKLDQIELLTEICQSPINKSGAPIRAPIMDTVAALESVVKGLSQTSGLIKLPKPCLVVLDDVWQHEDGFAGSTSCHTQRISRTQRNEAWASVLAMLRSLKSCKVVMTTRDKVCSTTLKADETIVLDGISQDPMKELLKHTAKSDQPPQELVQRIDKLKGSPRAALSLVHELKEANIKIQEQIILGELDDKNHIKGLYEEHLFTYHNLPLHLQSCLAFCSVFPYNWKFHPEKLTKMWIAHGFIDDTQVKQHMLADQKLLAMESVAKGYFKDLVDRSLFKIDTDGLYVIHVHIHSMIRQVSGDDCRSISNGSSSEIIVPATVRHLSVTAGCLAKLKPGPPLVESNVKPEDEFRPVRTLIVFTDKGAPSLPWSDIRQANSTLRKFKHVKVLDLTDTAITQVPDIVGELTHLRYLGVPNTLNHPPAQIPKLLLLYINHEATKTAPLMQSAPPYNPDGGGAGKAPPHNPGGGGIGIGKAPPHNPGGAGAGKVSPHNPGGVSAGKVPPHNPGGGSIGIGKAPPHNPGGGGAGKAPPHNPGGGGAGKAPPHNPDGVGAGKVPSHKAPPHNPGGGGAGKAPPHNPGGGGAGKAPPHNPGGGGAGKAPPHNPGGGGGIGIGKAPPHNPGGGGAGKAPPHNPGGADAGKASPHNPGGVSAGKVPPHNPGGGGIGIGKAPPHNPGGGGAGKAPPHNPGGVGAGKVPSHKAPPHNPGGGGAGKAPPHNSGGVDAGKSPLHKAPPHKAPPHNSGGGGAGKAPPHNPGGGGAGKALPHNPGGGGAGKAPPPCNFK
ncbi:putative disease resistance RPP13-like protein 1 [Triticum urartu]|uniref:putative disease resistance RPP13-like protein 1 n=1 Tax=Triticum urartu TaxID=4572 RepID=UPI002043169B|nr:putative disease resistance RPP13-like protein 1 [Triticum urartu]